MLSVAFRTRGPRGRSQLHQAQSKSVPAHQVAADVRADDSGVQTEEVHARVELCRVANKRLVPSHGVHVHVHSHGTVGRVSIEIIERADLTCAGIAHNEYPRLHSILRPALSQTLANFVPDRQPTQMADGHVLLDALRSFLTFGRSKDPSGEDDEIRVSAGSDALSLTHQAQVRFDEFDAWDVGIAEGLANDQNARAVWGHETA